MSMRRKNKGSGSQGQSVNAAWFTNATKRRRVRNKIAKKSRKENRK